MKKRLYQCERCGAILKGKAELNYHVNAHRRTDLPVKKIIAPKRPVVYDDETGQTAPH